MKIHENEQFLLKVDPITMMLEAITLSPDHEFALKDQLKRLGVEIPV